MAQPGLTESQHCSGAGSDDSAVYRAVSAVLKVPVHVGLVLGGAQFPQ